MGTSTGAERYRRISLPPPVVFWLVPLAWVFAGCEEGPATPGGDIVERVGLNPPSLSLAVGEVIRLDVLPVNSEGRVISAHPATWSTSAAAIADVDSLGLVRARSEGVAQISASVEGVVGTASVTVTPVVVSEWREHTCFISATGAIWCWGRGGNGELGNGARNGSSTPVRVELAEPAASVSVGSSHSCAVAASGAAYCWGLGVSGQLGNGQTVVRASPVVVTGGDSYRSVSAGGRHSCGITSVGDARCWGANDRGQLGDGFHTNVSTAVQPQGAPHFARISAGARHTCALMADGTAYCWGDNRNGQVGDGTLQERSTPTRVLTSLRFSDISAGARHSCAVALDGRPWCWGDNTNGQLGNGFFASSTVPQDVRSFPQFVLTRVFAGGSHTCGFNASGAAYCWGAGGFGQLGNGGNTVAPNPVVVFGRAFSDLVVGNAHTCGVDANTTVGCWGLNAFGQLGTGDFVDRAVPTTTFGGQTFRRGS